MTAYPKHICVALSAGLVLAIGLCAQAGAQDTSLSSVSSVSSAATPEAAVSQSAVSKPVTAKVVKARPAATAAPLAMSVVTPAETPADSAADASEAADYHNQLEAAAASLRADINAESQASAAEVSNDGQPAPSPNGMIAAAVIAGLGVLAMIVIIPASLRARRRRREAVIDMVSGKRRTKR